jgi:hypothetical protein
MVKIKTRNWIAVAAHFVNSAGPMKDRRSERGGACNTSRDLLDDYYLEDVVVDTGADCAGNNICIDGNGGNVGGV